MHLENSLTALEIGRVDDNLAVKSPRTKQSAVENFGSIASCKENHTSVRLEAIHFNEKRVSCLFALIVDSADMYTALPANGVKFVNENDAGCMLFGLLE